MYQRPDTDVLDWRAALHPDEAKEIARIDARMAEIAEEKKTLLANLAPIRSRAHKRARKPEARG